MYKLFSSNFWKEKNIPFHLVYKDPQVPFPLHTHNFHEIVFVVDGSCIHISKDENIQLRPGDVVNIRTGQAHGFKKIDKLKLINIMIYPHFLNDRLLSLSQTVAYQSLFEQDLSVNQNKIEHFTLSKNQMFEALTLLESMKTEIDKKNTGYQVQATAYFTQFLILLIRAYEEKQLYTLSPEALIVNYVEKNFRKAITLKELSKKSGLSESSLLRAFKKIVGEPPLTYQNTLRMNAATDDLEHTKKSITQIALDIGFNDSNYFSRVFKKTHKITPQDFRKYLKKYSHTEKHLPIEKH